MDTRNTIKLLILAALWGGSFIFMRALSPVFGPVLTASLRTLIAGIFLTLVFSINKIRIYWRRDFKHLLIIGIVNSSIPFFMYAYAALHIDASMSSILNSLSPMFGAIFSALFLIEGLTLRKGFGLVLGSVGVGIITSLNVAGAGTNYFLSVGACVLAATCYGLSSVYIKLKANHMSPKAIAAGSQVFAGLALLPFLAVNPPRAAISLTDIVLVIIFAILCSALAYLLYYDLIQDVGPTKALTVTYLIPVSAILWGMTLLGETITVQTAFGGGVILVGTYLVNSSGSKKPVAAQD